METKLPKLLHELAAMDKLPKGAYVDLPDKSQAWFVESVQKLADEVYTVNHRQNVLFTGFEAITVYFDVRSFAVVMREIMTHRLVDIAKAKGEKPTDKHFWLAQENTANLRKRLERAYNSQTQKGNVLELWKFSLAAYQAYVIYDRRFDDVMAMSLSKLARGAAEIGQQIEADALKRGDAAYFWKKR